MYYGSHEKIVRPRTSIIFFLSLCWCNKSKRCWLCHIVMIEVFFGFFFNHRFMARSI